MVHIAPAAVGAAPPLGASACFFSQSFLYTTALPRGGGAANIGAVVVRRAIQTYIFALRIYPYFTPSLACSCGTPGTAAGTVLGKASGAACGYAGASHPPGGVLTERMRAGAAAAGAGTAVRLYHNPPYYACRCIACRHEITMEAFY